MNDSEQLFQSTVEQLSELTQRLEGIAEVERTFDAKIEEVRAQVSSLIDRGKEVEEALDRLEALLNDIEAAFHRAEALQARLNELHDQIEAIDFQGLNALLQDTAVEVGRASTKLGAAIDRAEQPKKKGPIKR